MGQKFDEQRRLWPGRIGAMFSSKIRCRIRGRRTKAVGSRKMSKDTRIMQQVALRIPSHWANNMYTIFLLRSTSNSTSPAIGGFLKKHPHLRDWKRGCHEETTLEAGILVFRPNPQHHRFQTPFDPTATDGRGLKRAGFDFLIQLYCNGWISPHLPHLLGWILGVKSSLFGIREFGYCWQSIDGFVLAFLGHLLSWLFLGHLLNTGRVTEDGKKWSIWINPLCGLRLEGQGVTLKPFFLRE